MGVQEPPGCAQEVRGGRGWKRANLLETRRIYPAAYSELGSEWSPSNPCPQVLAPPPFPRRCERSRVEDGGEDGGAHR